MIDRDDIIFELHCAEGTAARNATLVRLGRAYPSLREDLVGHWCEIVLTELHLAANPDPAPTAPFGGGCSICFDQPAPALECPACGGSGKPCRPWGRKRS